jgi:hypothetical protein
LLASPDGCRHSMRISHGTVRSAGSFLALKIRTKMAS